MSFLSGMLSKNVPQNESVEKTHRFAKKDLSFRDQYSERFMKSRYQDRYCSDCIESFP